MSKVPKIYQTCIIPSGAIWWFANRTTAPDGWAICDGNNGTPNLIGKYPLGATSNIGTAVSESATFSGNSTSPAIDAKFTGSSVKTSLSGDVSVSMPMDNSYPTVEPTTDDWDGYLASPWKGAGGHRINRVVKSATAKKLYGKASTSFDIAPTGSVSGTVTLTPSGTISNITPSSVKLLPCMKL